MADNNSSKKYEEDEEVKMTCGQACNNWEKRPIWTPKWILLFMLCYGIWFTTLGVLLFLTTGQVVEISINYRYDSNCNTDPNDCGDATMGECVRYKQDNPVKDKWCQSSQSPYQSAPIVEGYLFEVPEEMPSPIYLYYQIDEMWQNHARFVKSTTNSAVYSLHMTGNCMDYQLEREGSVCADANVLNPQYGGMYKFSYNPMSGEGFGPISSSLNAIYKYWHPASIIGTYTGGCFPWWSTNDKDCVADPAEGNWFTGIDPSFAIPKAACKKGPEVKNKEGKEGSDKKEDKYVSGNRVHYPCGLAARWYFNDTFALTETDGTVIKIDETAESIAFWSDYKYKYRNLNPEGTFEANSNKDRSHDARFLNGFRFYEVMNMWQIAKLPPTVCEDDPLRLIEPFRHSAEYIEYANCQNYINFSYDKNKNKATCTYPPASELTNVKVPWDQTNSITCNTQVPNPAGWGVENSHYMVWSMIAGLKQFKKKWGNIDQTWKKGDKKMIWIANRYNLKYVQGEDTIGRKRIWFQNRSWLGGKYTYLAIMFGIASFLSWLTFIVILIIHCKDPRRLAKIDYLDWKDFA